MPASLLEEDSQQRLAQALFAGSRRKDIELHFNKGLAGGPREAMEATQAADIRACAAMSRMLRRDENLGKRFTSAYMSCARSCRMTERTFRRAIFSRRTGSKLTGEAITHGWRR
jgi:hypothetical protein